MIDHKKLNRLREKESRSVHLKATSSAKCHFVIKDLDSWGKRTKAMRDDALELQKNLLGDFDEHLDEPIDMHRKVLDKDMCFLSHPDKRDMYELEHGFKVNNIYYHGRKMIV